jgi:hypothetical protein
LRGDLRRIVPIVVGIVLLLLGAGWAAQGANVIGGSSLMDGNTIFVLLGGIIAVIGLALIGYGVAAKGRVQATTPGASAQV